MNERVAALRASLSANRFQSHPRDKADDQILTEALAAVDAVTEPGWIILGSGGYPIPAESDDGGFDVAWFPTREAAEASIAARQAAPGNARQKKYPVQLRALR